MPERKSTRFSILKLEAYFRNKIGRRWFFGKDQNLEKKFFFLQHLFNKILPFLSYLVLWIALLSAVGIVGVHLITWIFSVSSEKFFDEKWTWTMNSMNCGTNSICQRKIVIEINQANYAIKFTVYFVHRSLTSYGAVVSV